MERIQDAARLARLLHGTPLAACFEELPAGLELRRYDKGELLCSPAQPLRQFCLLLRGRVHIYGIGADGGSFSVYSEDRGALLGGMEFCRPDLASPCVEATCEVLCAALPMAAHRAELMQNTRFLWLLLDSMAEKVLLATRLDRPTQTLEDRVLTFLRDIQPDHTLHSIQESVARLHCSRRQLQRVVAKLCAGNVLEKTGKGCYRLTEKDRKA